MFDTKSNIYSHTKRKPLISCNPKDPLCSPRIQSFIEQNLVKTHDFKTSDNIKINQYNSHDTFETDHFSFDDDPVFNDNDDNSIMLDNKVYMSVNLNDVHQPFQSKSESGNIYHISRSSKFHFFNTLPHLSDASEKIRLE